MASDKIAYGPSAALTLSLGGLATSSTLVAGRASTAVVNTSDLYIDYLLAGYITTGTTPTVNTLIEVWVYGSFDDTPTYPDAITGTDAAKTMTSADIKASGLKLAAQMLVSASSNIAYPFGPVSVASLFRGFTVPKRWGCFVTHNTAVNLHATGGNHVLTATGVYKTIS